MQTSRHPDLPGLPKKAYLVLSPLALMFLLGADRCDSDPAPPPDPIVAPGCFIGGCSSEICSDMEGLASTCEVKPEAECYRTAACEAQADGVCGWTDTPELQACLDRIRPEPEPDPCYVGGCSGQLCGDTEGVPSTCEWIEEYACYRDAACERQDDGACGWTDTPELRMCIADAREPEPEPCFVGGCSSQLCSDTEGVASTCEFLEEYACYRDAACERQSDGACGWTETAELQMCIDDARAPEPEPCYVGGCSSQICSDTEGVVSTCEFLPEYACYRDATCERQTDGACGWTDTPDLRMCIEDAGAP